MSDAEMTARHQRRAELIAAHGKPEQVSGADALRLAHASMITIGPGVTAADICAFIYRDQAAADAWTESNRVHNGLPTVAMVHLPDGRVLGILDLRPSLPPPAREWGQTGPG